MIFVLTPMKITRNVYSFSVALKHMILARRKKGSVILQARSKLQIFEKKHFKEKKYNFAKAEKLGKRTKC